MRKFLAIAAICACAFSGFAGVNDNEVLSNFVKQTQDEIAASGSTDAAAMTVEQSPFGDMIVMTIQVPVAGAQLNQMPVDMIKPELIKELKAEGFPAEVLDAMTQERVNLVYRMQGTDGNSLDIFITPADLK